MSRYVNADDLQDWLSKLVITKLEKGESTTEIRLLKTFIDSMAETDVVLGDKLFKALDKSCKCPDALEWSSDTSLCDYGCSGCYECWKQAVRKEIAKCIN